MRIAICEDTPGDSERLKTLLEQYCTANQLDAEIDCYDSCEALLSLYRSGEYQILFLDILMTAAQIRHRDDEVAIIFVSVSREFAVDSYLVNAAYYLVKPVDARGLALAMERCRHVIQQHAASITVISNRRSVRLPLRDIMYLEAKRNDCIIYTSGGEVGTRLTLSSLDKELGGPPFLRCHRSFIVNLHWVQNIQERDFLMRNGSLVPISRTYSSFVQKQVVEYLKSGVRGQFPPS